MLELLHKQIFKEITCAGEAPSHIKVGALSDSRVVVAYQNNQGTRCGEVLLMALDDGISIIGTCRLEDDLDLISLAVVNRTTIVVVGQCGDRTAKMFLLEVKEDRIEHITSSRITDQETDNICVSSWSPHGFAVAYRLKGNGVITVFSDQLEELCSFEFAPNPIQLTITALNPTLLVMFYRSDDKGWMRALSMAGGLGEPIVFENNPVAFISAVVIDPNRLLICYRNDDLKGFGCCKIINACGSVLLSSGRSIIHERSSIRHSSIVQIDKRPVAVYGDNIARQGLCVELNVQSNKPLPVDFQTLVPQEMYDLSAVAIGNRVLVGYRQGMMKENAHGILALYQLEPD